MFNFLVYNKFKERKWKRLSPKKRWKYYQKMENITAKKVGRPVYEVIPKEWNDGTRGLCVYKEKAIYLNTDFFVKDNMQFFGLATLFHEQRHAQQHFVVKSKKKIWRFSKAYKWQQNMKGYIQYEGDEKYSYYSMQEVERDANKNALQRLKKFRFRFRKEKLYKYTVAEKEKEFDYVKEHAREELGMFYKLKLFLRNRKERKKNQ
jgi:hypothetical protein